jgi:hypothetical protein
MGACASRAGGPWQLLLDRHADEVGDDGRRRLVRHGHLPEREIMTSIGPVAVRCPRVRDRTSGKGAGASVSRQQAGRNPSAQ